jgi:hypothetical protein
MTSEIRNMDKYEFYKEHYFYEIERHYKLTDSLTLPVGVLTVIGSVIAFHSNKLSFGGWWDYSLVFLLVIALFFWIRSAYFLVCSRSTRSAYKYIGTPNVLEKYRLDLIEWNANLHSALRKTDEEINKEFEDYIIQTYVECVQHNTLKNDSKYGFLQKAVASLVYTLICTFLLVISSYIISLDSHHQDKIQKIEIIGTDKIHSMLECLMSKTNQNPTTANPKPVKPSPPPPRLIREGDQPPKPPSPKKETR